MNYGQAWAALQRDAGPAGEWAKRAGVRQLQRTWDNAKPHQYPDVQPPEPEERLEVVCVADVEMKEVEWVWPLRLARGKMTIIAGETGLGKSQIACDVAARIRAGGVGQTTARERRVVASSSWHPRTPSTTPSVPA